MGKDREGNFHPAKGMPSGANKEEGLGLSKNFNPDNLERDAEITARYTPVNEDELSPDVHLRHPNRNTSKGEAINTVNDTVSKSRQQAHAEDFSKTVPEELVSIIPKDLFSYLGNYQSDICISILIDTHDAGVAVNEQVDLIAFKNALQQVEKTLQQKNIEAGRIKRMLEPGHELMRDSKFWHNLSKGLAVYISDDFFKFIRLPGSVQNHVLVNSSFSVSPLIPFMVRKEYFYLLVISKKRVQFYRVDNFGIEHIPVDELPNGMEDVVESEGKDNHKLFRTGEGGFGAASFHGQGAGKPDEKQLIATYLEEVDDILWKTHLHRATVPLVLAGLDHLIPIYRSVADYSRVWPEALTGNHQTDDLQTLYQQAMDLMKPFFDEPLHKGLEEYGNKSATPLTATAPAEIIPASYYGRISHLFVQKDLMLWGSFKEDTNELKMTDEHAAGAENLADKAVTKTIQNGGEVYILEPDQMPQSTEMAAIFRY